MRNSDDNKDELTLRIEKNPCAVCKPFKLPTCNGHPISGGDNEGDSYVSSNEPINFAETKTDAHLAYNVSEKSSGNLHATDNNGKTLAMTPRLEQALQKLMKMLSELTITSDATSKTLKFAMKPNAKNVETLQEFLKLVENEYFKAKHDRSKKNSIALKDNQLIIHIHDKEHYDDFIIQLATKTLTLMRQAELTIEKNHELSKHSEKHTTKHKTPTPFKMVPKPKNIIE